MAISVSGITLERKKYHKSQFSADGTKLALTVCGPCKIGIYTIATQSVVYLTPPKGYTAYDVAFDTQSNTIAFIWVKEVAENAYDYQLAVSQMDGSGLKLLTTSDTRKRFPAFSLDGKKIVFEGAARCKATSLSYCFADIYEFDLQSHVEKRISNLQALQVGPAYFLPGNRQVITPIIGNLHPNGLANTSVVAKYGAEREVFIVDLDKESQYEQLALNTPTASSPQPLPAGEIAFTSRVNELENKTGRYIYDVFLWSKGVSRRLTYSSRYISHYAISNDARSVVLVGERKEDASKCNLILWNVNEGSGRDLNCEGTAYELPLAPS